MGLIAPTFAVPHSPPPTKAPTPAPPVATPREPAATPPALSLDPSPVGPIATTSVRPLRELTAAAQAIVLGTATRTESYDEDRLQLHRLRVERVLRGRVDDPEPGVVDVRGASARPPILVAGERAIVLLEPAPRLTYLAQHLPEGHYFTIVSGRDGVLPVASEAEAEAVERVLAEGAKIAALEEHAARAAARQLAFTELAAPSPRLAADAMIELRRLGRLSPLSPEEVAVLGRVLGNRQVHPMTRAGLIELLGQQGGPDALPALAGAAADTPAVLDALLAARARLGAAATRSELEPYLRAEDAAVRAAAVRALARLDDPDALAEVGRYATTDPDLSVRLAAVEALGQTKRPAAVPLLKQTFAAPEPALKQRSARAFLSIDGEAVEEALIDLALRGDSVETKTYAALILVVARGRDHAAVRRLEASNPSPEVRRVLEKGLEFRGVHQH